MIPIPGAEARPARGDCATIRAEPGASPGEMVTSSLRLFSLTLARSIVIPTTSGNPPGKLADAEVVFGAEFGPFCGLKLLGFVIWERRSGGRNVTFPARQYSVNGERRSLALLRPTNGERSAQEAMRTCILDAYARLEAHS